jgi:tRNA(adenine34) deaminase
MWQQLTEPWQKCVEEAWVAYCKGSLPIGAVLTDADGCIVARGRNRIYEHEASGKLLCGYRLAHAEINALIATDWSTVNARTCILYTTTEPCPLCVGAVRMTRVSEVRYASRDGAAGSADLFQANDFLQRGNVKVIGPENAVLETILIAMMVEFVLDLADENSLSWCERISGTIPDAAQIGQQLFRSKQLRQWRDANSTISFIIEQLAQQLENL